jgi:hypothetical protein
MTVLSYEFMNKNGKPYTRMLTADASAPNTGTQLNEKQRSILDSFTKDVETYTEFVTRQELNSEKRVQQKNDKKKLSKEDSKADAKNHARPARPPSTPSNFQNLDEILRSLKQLHNKIDSLVDKRINAVKKTISDHSQEGASPYFKVLNKSVATGGTCFFDTVNTFAPQFLPRVHPRVYNVEEILATFPDHHVFIVSDTHEHIVSNWHTGLPIIVLEVQDESLEFHATNITLSAPIPSTVDFDSNSSYSMRTAFAYAIAREITFWQFIPSYGWLLLNRGTSALCWFSSHGVVSSSTFNCPFDQKSPFCLNRLDPNFENRPYLVSELSPQYNISIDDRIYGAGTKPIIACTLSTYALHAISLDPPAPATDPFGPISKAFIAGDLYCLTSLFSSVGISIPNQVYYKNDLLPLTEKVKSNIMFICASKSIVLGSQTKTVFCVNLTADLKHADSISQCESGFVSLTNDLSLDNAAIAMNRKLKDARIVFNNSISELSVDKMHKASDVFLTIANPLEAMGKASRMPDGLGGKVALLDQVMVRDVQLNATSGNNFSVFGIIHTGGINANVYTTGPSLAGCTYLLSSYSAASPTGGLVKVSEAESCNWPYMNGGKSDVLSSTFGYYISQGMTNLPFGTAFGNASGGSACMRTWSALYNTTGSKIKFTFPAGFPGIYVNSGDGDGAIAIPPSQSVVCEFEADGFQTGDVIIVSMYTVDAFGNITLTNTNSVATVAGQSSIFASCTTPGSAVGLVGLQAAMQINVTRVISSFRVRFTETNSNYFGNLPFSIWTATPVPDYAAVSNGIASLYRNTARSLLLSDATPSLYQAGFISAAQISSGSPPGESGVLSPQSLSQLPYAINHAAKEGIYSAPYVGTTVSSRMFQPLDNSFNFASPYTVIMATLPYQVSYIFRYIAVTVYELRVSQTRLIETHSEPLDRDIVQALDDLFTEHILLTSNKFHWGAIADAFKSFGRSVGRYVPQVAPLLSDVLKVIGQNRAADVVGSGGRIIGSINSIVNPSSTNLSSHGVEPP